MNICSVLGTKQVLSSHCLILTTLRTVGSGVSHLVYRWGWGGSGNPVACQGSAWLWEAAGGLSGPIRCYARSQGPCWRVTLPFGCTLFPEVPASLWLSSVMEPEWLECPPFLDLPHILNPICQATTFHLFFFFKVETDCFLILIYLQYIRKLGGKGDRDHSPASTRLHI